MRALFVAAVVLFSSGCGHRQLQHQTVRQVSTLSDLYQQQILENVAMFSANPDAIPSFAVPGGGVVNVDTGASGGGNLNFVAAGLDGYGFTAGGSRTVSGNWSVGSIVEPDKLALMRCMFRHAIGYDCAEGCAGARESLARHFGPDWEQWAVPAGWYHVGTKHDVPKNACAVAHYGKTYVWVTAEGRDALARFTLSTLDVATVRFLDPPPPTKEVTEYTYNKAGELIRTEKRTVVDPVTGPDPRKLGPRALIGLKPEELPAVGYPKERLNFYDPYRGYFSLPRSR